MFDVNRHYSNSRMYHEENFSVYKLTERDRIMLGLKKKEKLKGNIRVCVPLHYGSKGVWWESMMVTDAELPEMMAKYPNLQVIEGRCLSA